MADNNKNTKLPIIYIILGVIGSVLLILGIILIITTFSKISKDPLGSGFSGVGTMAVGGFCLVGGFGMLFFGLMPKIQKTMIKTQRHIINENKEDLTDIASTGADITSKAVTKTVRAIKEGLENDKSEDGHASTKYCEYCGGKVKADSNFCSHCGKEL